MNVKTEKLEEVGDDIEKRIDGAEERMKKKERRDMITERRFFKI